MRQQNVPSQQAMSHVPADYTSYTLYSRKQTLKEEVPDLCNFLCAESCLVQVTFIRPSVNGFWGFKMNQIMK